MMPQTPDMHLSDNRDIAPTIVEDSIIRKQINVTHSMASVHHRQRLENPFQDTNIQTYFRNVGTAGQSPTALAMVHSVVDRAYTRAVIIKCASQDDGIINYFFEKKAYEDQLSNLYFRGRVRSTVWGVFMTLCMRGIISFSVLAEEIHYLVSHWVYFGKLADGPFSL